MAGSDAADGLDGSALKSVFTLTFCDAMTYSASFSANVPASSVSAADGAIVRLVAPSTAFSSYTDPSPITSPSTSKKVVCSRSKAGICSLVPAYTKRKSNSAARIVVGVPSAQLAITRSSTDPEEQYDARSPKPRHTKPDEVSRACDVLVLKGVTYATSTSSLYSEGSALTLTSRSNALPLSVPTRLHRMLPPGSAAPVVSVVWRGIIVPVEVAPSAPVHSMATAGLVMDEKSTRTPPSPQ
jgi:hypothetical protein